MATASAYITVTGQTPATPPNAWTDTGNVAGAPDTSVASVSAAASVSVNELDFSHGITIPSGSTVTQVSATLRMSNSAVGRFFLDILLNGSDFGTNRVLSENQIGLNLPALTDKTFTETDPTKLANATSTNINAGTGKIAVLIDVNAVIAFDSVQITIEYTPPSVQPNDPQLGRRKFFRPK